MSILAVVEWLRNFQRIEAGWKGSPSSQIYLIPSYSLGLNPCSSMMSILAVVEWLRNFQRIEAGWKHGSFSCLSGWFVDC